MKSRFLTLFFLLALSSLLLAGCAQGIAQGVVDLPDYIEIGIQGVLVWIVSWLITQLITLLPFLKFLDEYKEPFALGLAAELILLIEQAVPDAFGDIAVKGIALLLAIVAFFGVGSVLRAKKVRGFR